MKDFAMQHPWLVFWLALVLICGVDSMWENWCNRNKPPAPVCNCSDEE